jgi:hypothetical protein
LSTENNEAANQGNAVLNHEEQNQEMKDLLVFGLDERAATKKSLILEAF